MNNIFIIVILQVYNIYGEKRERCMTRMISGAHDSCFGVDQLLGVAMASLRDYRAGFAIEHIFA